MPYVPRRRSHSVFLPIRGLRYHLHSWGDVSLVTPDRPLLMLVHGWMDVGASFQFVVDALAHIEGFERWVVAPDWRGFGGSDSSGTDTYWFPDYLGDLDALIDALAPSTPLDLVGHSMGGNIVMSYAGVRPQRIRRLVNLEGFGLPATAPAQAPRRLGLWLDQIRQPQSLRSYDSLDGVAARLIENNPLISADKAAWLAPHWSRQGDDGRWHILGDPAHKRVNPVLYQPAEVVEAWKLIEAPLLWVEGEHTQLSQWWGQRYQRAEFDARLAVVRHVQRVRLMDCGHMLHHDQPERLAAALAAFLADG